MSAQQLYWCGSLQEGREGGGIVMHQKTASDVMQLKEAQRPCLVQFVGWMQLNVLCNAMGTMHILRSLMAVGVVFGRDVGKPGYEAMRKTDWLLRHDRCLMSVKHHCR